MATHGFQFELQAALDKRSQERAHLELALCEARERLEAARADEAAGLKKMNEVTQQVRDWVGKHSETVRSGVSARVKDMGSILDTLRERKRTAAEELRRRKAIVKARESQVAKTKEQLDSAIAAEEGLKTIRQKKMKEFERMLEARMQAERDEIAAQRWFDQQKPN